MTSPDAERELGSLLAEATGLEPEPGMPVHVRLDHGIGAVSVQRAGLEYRGEALTLGVWPGELKAQAQHLYSEGRAQRLLTLETAEGWQVRPSPHLAFFTAPPAQRAYLTCRLSPADYVSRWAGADHAYIGAYTPEAVREELWPWLVSRGYASEQDRSRLEEFLSILGGRDAHLRPGITVYRFWAWHGVEDSLDRRSLIGQIREAIEHVLRLLGEPPLPFSSRA